MQACNRTCVRMHGQATSGLWSTLLPTLDGIGRDHVGMADGNMGCPPVLAALEIHQILVVRT